jgi:hypothetical protein
MHMCGMILSIEATLLAPDARMNAPGYLRLKDRRLSEGAKLPSKSVSRQIPDQVLRVACCRPCRLGEEYRPSQPSPR